VFGAEFVEIVIDLHEQGCPKWEIGLIESNDPPVTDLLKLETNISRGVVELWQLEDRVRQRGERLPRASRGQPREMTLANGFDAVTYVGLLVEVIKCLWIDDSQQYTNFDVFLKIDPVRVDSNAILVSNRLAADIVEQRGESVDDTVS